MSTNLEYRARERQQASEAQREKKNKGDLFLLEEQHENFVAAVAKWEMLAATNARWKWAAVKKSEREHILYYISTKKRVTKKFLEISRCSCAKQWQRKVQKKVCCTCKVAFFAS